MKRSCVLFVFILGLWLGLTCFLDFFAVPTVFRNVSSRQEAGTIGMILFLALNKMEILFSLILGATAWNFRNTIKWKKTFWASIGGLFVLTLVYTFHMSPMIIESNKQKYEVEEGSPEYQKLEATHLFYHNLFRKTDGTKILVLLVLFGSTLRRREEEA